ncbi:MAG: hypothetical protein V8R55_01150 [Dysosmobacter sp.]
MIFIPFSLMAYPSLSDAGTAPAAFLHPPDERPAERLKNQSLALIFIIYEIPRFRNTFPLLWAWKAPKKRIKIF